MMRWKKIDDTKDGEPPEYAIHICGTEWMVLQEFNKVLGVWQDVPLHIEKSDK